MIFSPECSYWISQLLACKSYKYLGEWSRVANNDLVVLNAMLRMNVIGFVRFVYAEAAMKTDLSAANRFVNYVAVQVL
jgi:hypothetical protein